MLTLRVHGLVEKSLVNGAGERLVIWTQGCTKGCRGCFNPNTWRHGVGDGWDATKLAEHVKELNPAGLTLSGGDPLEQPEALLEFLQALHDEDGGLSILPRGIICFTGYTMDEVMMNDIPARCLEYIDLLIDGRYVEELRHTNGLSGSSNQQFHFSSAAGRGRARIPEETITDQSVEIHVRDSGSVDVTGFPDYCDELRQRLRELGLRQL